MLRAAWGFLAVCAGGHACRDAGRLPAGNGARRCGGRRGPGPDAGRLRRSGRPGSRRAAEYPDLAGPHGPGDQGPGRRAPGGPGAGRGPPGCCWPPWPRAGMTKSVALQLAKWTTDIPAEFRGQAEEILVAAARAGADLRALAAICAEIRARTAPPDPDVRPGPGPRGIAGDHPGRRRGLARRPHPRVRRDGAGRAGRPVRSAGRRRPAHPPGALPRRARRGHAPAAGLRSAAQAGRSAGQGPRAYLLRRAVRPGHRLRAAGQVDRRLPGPVGRAPRRRLGEHRRRRRLAGRRGGPPGSPATR